MAQADHHSAAGSRRFADDTAAMRYALHLALRGQGSVEPNPCVGAVILDAERRLVAAGWHESFGQAHAEVNAIRRLSTGNDGSARNDLDLIVTLEPCSHTGKTPPCTEAVLAAGFRRVVIGCTDPAPHACGRGISVLRAAGVHVLTGVCEAEAQRLIAPFSMLTLQRRPWVIAKWAMTLDGRIATSSGHSQWISSQQSRDSVHQMRGRVDAIITGAGTVRSDDPLLTARPAGTRRALRVVMDRCGTAVSAETQLFRTAQDVPVCVAVTAACSSETEQRLAAGGIEVLRVAADQNGQPQVAALLHELGRRQCTNVLLEAGAGILGAFQDARCIDEVSVYVAPKLIGGASARGPVGGLGLERIPAMPNLSNVTVDWSDGDLHYRGDVVHGSGAATG